MRVFAEMAAPPYSDFFEYVKPFVERFMEGVEDELDGVGKVVPVDANFGMAADTKIPDTLTTQGAITFKKSDGFWEQLVGSTSFVMSVHLDPLRKILSQHGITSFRTPFMEAAPSPPSWDTLFQELSRQLEYCPIKFDLSFRGLNYTIRGTLKRAVRDVGQFTTGAGTSPIV